MDSGSAKYHKRSIFLNIISILILIGNSILAGVKIPNFDSKYLIVCLYIIGLVCFVFGCMNWGLNNDW